MSEHDAFARAILAELCAKFPLGYVPTLEWRGLRVSAGMAYYPKRTIALSHRILREEADVRTTLLHEYAHLLAVHRHGRKGVGHGGPWQQAMRDLGIEPKVRHNYPVERNQARQNVTYRCVRCGRSFIRGRRFPRRTMYVHVNCGGELRLESIRRVISPEETA